MVKQLYQYSYTANSVNGKTGPGLIHHDASCVHRLVVLFDITAQYAPDLIIDETRPRYSLFLLYRHTLFASGIALQLLYVLYLIVQLYEMKPDHPNHPATGPRPGYIFESRFFWYCCFWAIQFFKNYQIFILTQFLIFFDIFCILGQTFFKMRSGCCRMHSKLLYKRGTKTNELF